jgi:hypothetical protein
MRRSLPFGAAVCTTLAALSLVAGVAAQVPGRNINMVSGRTFPGGDPFLQKQNEPSVAISTRNPCHLLGGSNDYRAVNLPGLPGDGEIGDAWLGWYESTDCGATWYSTLVPGYPQDRSPEGLASPMRGFSAGADPVVRAGAAGTFYYSFIVFNRGTNLGKLGLARAIDHNNRETFIHPDALRINPDGTNNQRRRFSPIQYVGTTEVARGSEGRFIDKPSLAVFPARHGTCLMDGEVVPATNVYVAWTEFLGHGPNRPSKVYFARSSDCGATFPKPHIKLSEGGSLGQGTAIAINPKNPDEIYVVWRQVRNDRELDALLYARSWDGGRRFTKPEPIPGFAEGQFAPFDQNTTSTSVGSATTTFRTIAYPTLAFADDGYLYMAVSQVPGGPTGTLGGRQARITITRTNGKAWMPPVFAVPFDANGQQFMPALSYAAGRLQLIWYDVRFDEAERHDDRLIDEAAALQSPGIRRTIDLLGAQTLLPSQWPLVFSRYGVAQPDYNDIVNGVRPLNGPRISQYLVGDPTPAVPDGGPRQLLFNRGNLLLYGGGTIPFIGDYVDIAAVPFVRDTRTNRWVLNGLENAGNAAMATFHATWTDNRDAGIGKATLSRAPDGTTRLDYFTPLRLPEGATINDVECPVPGIDNTRTRDANVYTSRIVQDFTLTAPVNSKRTDTPGVVRTFPVSLENGTDTASSFVLSLSSANASFAPETFLGSFPACAPASAAPLQTIIVNVLPKSSVTRTVFVNCGVSAAERVVVTATRIDDGLSASVVLNPDPSVLPTEGPTGERLGPEAHNPDAENPDAENPDAENPDAENPDAENPDAENPDAENPDAENPDAENPDAENPDAENPDAENPDAENANFQDISVDLTNDGDTTSGYQIAVQLNGDMSGYSFLLLGNRVYDTPTSINCHLVSRRTNQQLFAVSDPDTSGIFLDLNDASEKNATLLVRPGESVRLVLRVVWNSAATGPFCSTDPSDPNYCFNRVAFRVRAQAPNTGETVPREDVLGRTEARADLLLAADVLETTTTVAAAGGFIDTPGATMRNDGFTDAGPFVWGGYIRNDANTITPTGTIGRTESLAAGAALATGPARVTIPRFTTVNDKKVPLPPGNYVLGINVDESNDVDESNENNNTLESAVVQVVGYTATITVPDGTPKGKAFAAIVNVRGPDGKPVPGAWVTLSLEGPNAVPQVPGPPGSMTPANPRYKTNSKGYVVFEGLRIAQSGKNYRMVAAVEIAGLGTVMFQSDGFKVIDKYTKYTK